ncbi:50S ribosomal protein L3 [Candidatus Woesearchaeota archaeon]|nr:50S ribosomal protein L3 [Candidatus Woesearchaeota archaeon]
MSKRNAPRRGSLQFWPRVRAKRAYPRVGTWATIPTAKLLGFAGYKVGMTHLLIVDNKSTSKTKGQEIFCPVTVLECPPLKIAALRFYKKTLSGSVVVAEVPVVVDAELGRKITVSKKDLSQKLGDVEKTLQQYDDLKILMYTQPKLTGFGKKKPELFEVGIGGSLQEKFAYSKGFLGKEIPVTAAFQEGQFIDVHAVTRGKGFQGPRRRFGVMLRSHKSEKSRRNPGNVGPWTPKKASWRVAHAGKMGYHNRVDYNKWIIKIGDQAKDIVPKGGFLRYGNVKSTYVLVKGSIAGPSKRLIRLTTAIRAPTPHHEAPTVAYTSLASKQ